MPKVSVTVPHELGSDEAAGRLRGFGEGLRDKYKDQIKDLEEHMEGNRGTFSFKTMGLKVGGEILVEDSQATVNCDLPFAAAMFKGRIEKEIRAQLERALA